MSERFDRAKLLAYVLGELERDEAREVAALVEQDAEIRAEVQSLRSMTNKMEQVFIVNEDIGFSPAQIESIRKVARKKIRMRNWFWAASTFAVASIAIVLLVPHNDRSSDSQRAGVAVNTTVVPPIQKSEPAVIQDLAPPVSPSESVAILDAPEPPAASREESPAARPNNGGTGNSAASALGGQAKSDSIAQGRGDTPAGSAKSGISAFGYGGSKAQIADSGKGREKPLVGKIAEGENSQAKLARSDLPGQPQRLAKNKSVSKTPELPKKRNSTVATEPPLLNAADAFAANQTARPAPKEYQEAIFGEAETLSIGDVPLPPRGSPMEADGNSGPSKSKLARLSRLQTRIPKTFAIEKLFPALEQNLNGTNQCFEDRALTTQVTIAVELSEFGNVLQIKLSPRIPKHAMAVTCLEAKIANAGPALKPLDGKKHVLEIVIDFVDP